MRHNNSGRRPRKRNNSGRNNNGGNGNSRSRVYDSNGPDVRIRGTAFQVADKYESLAKDSMSSGNIVLAQSYLQHAEHYRRLIGEFEANSAQNKSNAQQKGRAKSAPVDDNAGNKKTLPGMSDDLALPTSILGGDVKSEDAKADGGKADVVEDLATV